MPDKEMHGVLLKLKRSLHFLIYILNFRGFHHSLVNRIISSKVSMILYCLEVLRLKLKRFNLI